MTPLRSLLRGSRSTPRASRSVLRSSPSRLRRRLSAIGVALLLVLVPTLSLASAAPARAAGGAAACQASGGAYIYVQGVTQGCSTSVSNGVAAINSVARTSWSGDGMLLQINGSPASPDPRTKGYWSYWIWTGGSWEYAQVGPYSDTSLAGKVRAWKYIGLAPADRVAPSWTPPAAARKPAATSGTTTKRSGSDSKSSSRSGSKSESRSDSTSGSRSGSTGHSSGSDSRSSSEKGSHNGSGEASGSSRAGVAASSGAKASASAHSSPATPGASGSTGASASPSASGTDGPTGAAGRLAADAPTGTAPADSSDETGSGSGGSAWPLVGAAVLVGVAVTASVIAVRRRH